MNTEPPYAGLKWAHYLRVMLLVPLDQGTQGNKGRKGISLFVWSENGPKLQIRATFTAASRMKWFVYSPNFRDKWRIMVEVGKGCGFTSNFDMPKSFTMRKTELRCKMVNSQSDCRTASCIPE